MHKLMKVNITTIYTLTHQNNRLRYLVKTIHAHSSPPASHVALFRLLHNYLYEIRRPSFKEQKSLLIRLKGRLVPENYVGQCSVELSAAPTASHTPGVVT